jgi:hypothetical protein
MSIKLVLAASVLVLQVASAGVATETDAGPPVRDSHVAGVMAAPAQSQPGRNWRSYRGFRISGNRILDPLGRPFIVKGADAVYGRFAGGNANGWGLINYQHAQRDLDNMRVAGYNLARISVSYDLAHLPATSPDYVPTDQYLSELDNVIRWVTQRGMVAEVSNGNTARSDDVNSFIELLARRYHSNPLVWFKPDNEPNCEDGDPLKCLDWLTWQQQESRYVRTIRATGYLGPIVINCIAWSFDCSRIFDFPLRDQALVYGAHRYGGGAATWDAVQQAETDLAWANLAARVPVIVDEVGTNSSKSSPLAWSRGFLSYVVDWVMHRGGDGCIAFVNSWSDDNMMIDAVTGGWNAWGQTFIASYLKALPSADADDDELTPVRPPSAQVP